MPPAAYNSSQVPSVLKALRAQGILQPSEARAGEDVVIAYDLDALHTGFDRLVQAFPPHFLHCYAIKAAPMGFILQAAIHAGLGLEAASILEVENALLHGCPPEKIVFDSPAKTYKELDFALSKGIHINANTLEELDRIASILSSSSSSSSSFPPPSVGLRINPLVGAGTIQELSVATATSKFGVPLTLNTSPSPSSFSSSSSSSFSSSSSTNQPKIISYFHKYTWLTGLHIHVGSQGLGMDQLAQGVNVLLALTQEVEASLSKEEGGREGGRRITTLDIGGGLAANYLSDEVVPTHAQLVEVLREASPSLFGPSSLSSSNENGSSRISMPFVRVVTEFGRSLTAKTAWLASRVEYAFDNEEEGGREGGLRTAILHAGADVLLRECYVPGKFPHRFTVHDKYGHLVEGEEGGREEGQVQIRRLSRTHNLAGPLCFAGDVIKRDIALPKIESGDWVVVHDVGGYTLALFSRYCSRAAPAVVGYRIGGEGRREGGGEVTVEVLQGREAGERVLEFWGERGGRVG